jgi:hypothetical protein
MRHPAEDEIDELCGEFFYLIAPNILPGCPPPGAGLSVLRSVASPPAADSGEDVGCSGRYPLGMQGGLR